MKKTFLLLMPALMVGFASCDKDKGCDVCEKNLVTVSIDGVSSGTRASNVTSIQEDTVNFCKVYVFDSEDAFQGLYTVDTETSMAGFYLSTGTYSFYAFANAASLPGAPESPQQLLSTATALSDNSVGNFVMGGSVAGQTISGDVEVSVSLKRFVSKFTCLIRNDSKGGEDVEVDEIYLTNVAGENNIGLTAVPGTDGVWYNKLNYVAGDLESLLYAGGAELGKMLAHGDSLSTAHSFYAYPNDTGDDPRTYPQWSARHTRFVVKAKFDGDSYYYPVTLSSVGSNKWYHIDMTITGPGVDNPEDPVGNKAYVKVRVSVAPWDKADTISQTF